MSRQADDVRGNDTESVGHEAQNCKKPAPRIPLEPGTSNLLTGLDFDWKIRP